MRLIGTELGRTVVLLTPEEWRPTRLSTFDAFSAIKERYSFVYSPNFSIPWDTLQKDGYKFSLGKLRIGERDTPIQELSFYNDGIVVNANNTDDAEAIYQDLINWAKESAGIRDLTNVGRKVFVSNVVVEFERSVNQLINGFKDFSLLLSKLIRATYNTDLPVQLRTLAFHHDQLALPESTKLGYFSIDRRIGHKYDENRFFCEAPLRTSDHLHALEALENLLSK